jgi:putative DNA primase/helicase
MSDAECTCNTAVAYATLGWLVFPVWPVRDGRCGCGDPDCTRPGKHPHGGLAPHGLKNGTRDEATICRWFNNGNLLNLAVCTGWESGILVLDVDLKNDGEASLAALGKLPETATARSGGGGKHLYFKMPAEDIRSTAADKSKKDPPLGPGIDIRANGGSIIVPPSVHVSGA